MERYFDASPFNAKVTIDYDKRSVAFDYPKKKKRARWKDLKGYYSGYFGDVFIIFCVLYLFGFMILKLNGYQANIITPPPRWVSYMLVGLPIIPLIFHIIPQTKGAMSVAYQKINSVIGCFFGYEIQVFTNITTKEITIRDINPSYVECISYGDYKRCIKKIMVHPRKVLKVNWFFMKKNTHRYDVKILFKRVPKYGKMIVKYGK